MSLYSVVIFIHVLAAAVLIGSGVASPLLRGAVRNASTKSALLGWLGYARQAGSINPMAAMVLLASGIYLGTQGWWKAGWFMVGVAVWVANLLLASQMIQKLAQRIGQTAASLPGEALSREVDELRWTARWDVAAEIMLANDLATLFIMTNKTGLLESIAIVLLANAALVAFALQRRRSRLASVGSGGGAVRSSPVIGSSGR